MSSVNRENPGKLAVYTLRLERAKLEALRRVAAGQNRTVQGELRQMVDERIAGFEDQRAA